MAQRDQHREHGGAKRVEPHQCSEPIQRHANSYQPVVAAILAGTFTSIRYVLNLTDTIEANRQTLVNIERDIKVAEDKLTEVATRLSAAEATWDMAENLYRQLADQVREHEYDIKDLSR